VARAPTSQPVPEITANAAIMVIQVAQMDRMPASRRLRVSGKSSAVSSRAMATGSATKLSLATAPAK
jgi:hypothetical protein